MLVVLPEGLLRPIEHILTDCNSAAVTNEPYKAGVRLLFNFLLHLLGQCLVNRSVARFFLCKPLANLFDLSSPAVQLYAMPSAKVYRLCANALQLYHLQAVVGL